MEKIASFVKLVVFIAIILNFLQLGCPQVAPKVRICVVAPKDAKAEVARFCNELGGFNNSGAECILAPDRLTCLRHVARGRADLTTLQSEDLVVASRTRSASDQVAVTNQLRTLAKSAYEYEMVAVVRKSANITNITQLKNSTFCHPGFGYETDWTSTVSRFLEARVVPQRCDPSLTLIENALNSAAQFFRAACKAGPWVPDQDLDAELKSRYPSLCALCDLPTECSTLDKYWGRDGSIYCLQDGSGDVLWARLEHVKKSFMPDDPNVTPAGSASDYSLLCPDGTLLPLETLEEKDAIACMWLSRPWPVVVANRKVAGTVQNLVSGLAKVDKDDSWQRTLMLLVAPLHQHTPATPTVTTPEEMLDKAGWISASTVSSCGALGSPRFCVSTSSAASKCQYLSETARAHGVRGPPLCVKASDCLAAVAAGEADITTAHPDFLHVATRDYKLKVLMYEHPGHSDELYLATALVKTPNDWTLGDLRGKRACFPTPLGASWLLALSTLRNVGLLRKSCDDVNPLLSFFSSVCVAHPSNGSVVNDNEIRPCRGSFWPITGDNSTWNADKAALKCLADGYCDVAFVDKSMLNVIGNPSISWARHLRLRDFHTACDKRESHNCYMGWAPQGVVLIRENEKHAHIRQWRTMLEHLNELFGPNHRAVTPSMLMFGPFDNQTNLIFHNSTYELVDYESLTQETSDYGLGLIQVLRENHAICHSVGTQLTASLVLVTAALLVFGVDAVTTFFQLMFTVPPCCR